MGYLPTEDHGVIGDPHTAALVGIDGTADWLCLPRLDAPSVFGVILDDEKGGHFKLAPRDYVRSQQLYLRAESRPVQPAAGSGKETRHD